MSYRGPDVRRNANYADDVFRYAGNTATWRQFVSAVTGVGVAGFGETTYYREQLITGVFGNNVPPGLLEKQRDAGMMANGAVQAVTREKLGRRDELKWRGDTYRVESDPVPSRLAGQWVTVLQRGE